MRFRAIPLPAPVGSLNIGVTMTPTSRVRCAQAATGTAAPSGAVSGVYVKDVSQWWSGGGGCTYLVYMLGVGFGTAVEWSIVWDGMESAPGEVYFNTDAFGANDPLQIIETITGSDTGIIAYATVEGVTYQSEPQACEF